jgi:hypothetical protein
MEDIKNTDIVLLTIIFKSGFKQQINIEKHQAEFIRNTFYNQGDNIVSVSNKGVELTIKLCRVDCIYY